MNVEISFIANLTFCGEGEKFLTKIPVYVANYMHFM